MIDTPEGIAVAPEATQFDPIEFTLAKPLATPHELAIAFGQLIDGLGDLTGVSVVRTMTSTLSVITISWLQSSVPSEEWLQDVESQLRGFGACTGVQVCFRRH